MKAAGVLSLTTMWRHLFAKLNNACLIKRMETQWCCLGRMTTPDFRCQMYRCFIFASRFRIHIRNLYLHQKLLPASWCWHTCIFGKIWELALKAVDFHSITLPEPYQPLHSVCVWLTWKPLIKTGGGGKTLNVSFAISLFSLQRK